jgi:hypothetical protein
MQTAAQVFAPTSHTLDLQLLPEPHAVPLAPPVAPVQIGTVRVSITTKRHDLGPVQSASFSQVVVHLPSASQRPDAQSVSFVHVAPVAEPVPVTHAKPWTGRFGAFGRSKKSW